MGRLFLSKQQIDFLVEKIGLVEASKVLNRLFKIYRIYLNSNDMRELYDHDYLEGIRATAVHEFVSARYKIHIYNRYSYEYLLTKAGRGSVLDIGCGDGHFVLALASQGFKCSAIDSSEELIGEARMNARRDKLEVDFFCEDCCNLDLESRFDYVALNDVVEHLSDKELYELFGRIGELLKPGGEIIIHTPNGLALCNETDWSVLQFIYKLCLRLLKKFKHSERTIRQMYYDQVHINIKSYRQLGKFLSQIGFRHWVIYDAYKNSVLRSVLSSNMLIVARAR